jgi:hypothetical protein
MTLSFELRYNSKVRKLSVEQCMATLSGNGGICSPNQTETPYWASSKARRGYQRAY